MPFIVFDLQVLHLIDCGGNLLVGKNVSKDSVKVVFVALEKGSMYD
jgi:hypothetical protein